MAPSSIELGRCPTPCSARLAAFYVPRAGEQPSSAGGLRPASTQPASSLSGFRGGRSVVVAAALIAAVCASDSVGQTTQCSQHILAPTFFPLFRRPHPPTPPPPPLHLPQHYILIPRFLPLPRPQRAPARSSARIYISSCFWHWPVVFPPSATERVCESTGPSVFTEEAA